MHNLILPKIILIMYKHYLKNIKGNVNYVIWKNRVINSLY